MITIGRSPVDHSPVGRPLTGGSLVGGSLAVDRSPVGRPLTGGSLVGGSLAEDHSPLGRPLTGGSLVGGSLAEDHSPLGRPLTGGSLVGGSLAVDHSRWIARRWAGRSPVGRSSSGNTPIAELLRRGPMPPPRRQSVSTSATEHRVAAIGAALSAVLAMSSGLPIAIEIASAVVEVVRRSGLGTLPDHLKLIPHRSGLVDADHHQVSGIGPFDSGFGGLDLVQHDLDLLDPGTICLSFLCALHNQPRCLTRGPPA